MRSHHSTSPETPSDAPRSSPAKRGLLSQIGRLARCYADWLVSISWLRLIVLYLLFLSMTSSLEFILLGGANREPTFAFGFTEGSSEASGPPQADEKPSKIPSPAAAAPTIQVSRSYSFGPEFRPRGAFENLTWLWFLLSLILKIAHRGRVQAESRAESALKTAEKADVERQVTEARLSTLQSQLEPHFLFNTLSSIDYLIQTDPPKAGNILRSFIAFLRASLPSIRNSRVCPLRPLGAEIDLVEAYLQIQKARMEDRLRYSIEVPQTLRSALCPPFMLQTLAENAIKHGLEPKREGGSLQIAAFVENRHLQLTVRDSGIGLGAVSQASSGTGLTNLRERLRLLFGQDAHFSLRSEPGSGTLALLHLPYSTEPRESSPPEDLVKTIETQP